MAAAPSPEKQALQSLTPEQLVRDFPPIALAEARRVVSAVHREQDLEQPLPHVRRLALEQVRQGGHVPRLELIEEQRSTIDPFVKLAFRTHDAHVIEAVRIPLENHKRFSACVSSQAGCALGCRFCATGTLGLKRNLQTWEIVEQVRHLRDSVRGDNPAARVHGVVFQGMGEPLANLEHVLEAIEVFREPCALAIDARNITVCTSGLPVGIRRLAREAPRARLGLSIHSAKREVRRSLMPIERAHPLDEVLDASVEHCRLTGYAPMWAVTLLAGINDSDEDAQAIARLMQDFRAKAGKRPRLSIIPYNPVPGAPFERTSDERQAAYRNAISALGETSHLRYSGGGDVAAACGQLAGAAS
jgi:23S rRNA (adenine2503-C2)-methyltransferase